jgi:nicotinate-nucleotide adenylyltransferase
MNIGLLGGTFDPIHVGHLIIAEEVRLKLTLDEVLFIPTGQPWLKSERRVACGEHRLEMLQLAISSNPHFKVSTVELERPGASYSVDTVSALKDELGAEVELYFIVGFDAFAELPIWREPSRLLDLCQVVGVRRPGYAELDWRSLEQAIPGISSRVLVVDVPQIDISSSQIRERAAKGLSIRYLVPEAVEGYISKNRLYT